MLKTVWREENPPTLWVGMEIGVHQLVYTDTMENSMEIP